jgi:predicted phage terminase large subunit-like protein
MDSDVYKEVFPEVALAVDSKAAGRWETNKGGEYFATGVGGAMTGRGANYLVIDDPHSEQDALSETAMERAHEWYTSGPRQRLQPGGRVLLVMCMTGDTPVLMADGQEKSLRDIRPGDLVATYKEGRITTSRVNNWKSSGVDKIFTIKTQSGKIVRANERHPFLVDLHGERKWIRLKELAPGMLLVATRPVHVLPDHKVSQGFVMLAKRVRHITRKTLMLLTGLLGFTGSGRMSTVKSVLQARQKARGYVEAATPSSTPRLQPLRNSEGKRGLNLGTGSLFLSMRKWLQSVKTYATSVSKSQVPRTQERIGIASFVSTIVTTQRKFVDYCVTIATWLWAMAKPQKTCYAQLSIYGVVTDKIVEIFPCGEEEVFDVEVGTTENFIANGIVSHNTRWSKADLTEMVLKDQARNPLADKWEVIEFPAIMPSGKPCWPEFWKVDDLLAVKAALPVNKWNAQWQQNPTSEEGAIFKREWWKVWQSPNVPSLQYVIQSYDTAYSKKETADFSAITTWGVFRPSPDDPESVILLDAKKGRWDFPELKRVAFDLYKFWDPDCVLIEAKAAGLPLSQELRRTGIPVVNYSPGGRNRATDKVSRANSVSPLFEAGFVWAPDEPWAEELVEEMAEFPYGEHDDLTDSAVQAIIRFRQGNFLALPSDYAEESLGPREFSYY